METISFDRLLLKTAFCCMASDGEIDKRELELIKKMCEESPLFKDFDHAKEINQLVEKLNKRGKDFISYYFELLKIATLSVEEQLQLIDFAVKTIEVDEKVEYSEIKFFKVIRHNLPISDEIILAQFPQIESWLEDDIVNDSFLERITKQYLDLADSLPKFEFIDGDIKDSK